MVLLCFEPRMAAAYVVRSFFGEGAMCRHLAHSDNDDIDGHWVVDHHLLFEKDGGHV